MTRKISLVEVHPSPIHGHGAFAVRQIARRTIVGRYEGRRYGPRKAVGTGNDCGVTYLFGLSDGSTIDGAEGGNATRHLNHSCEPNCEAQETTNDDGSIGVDIIAKRLIRSGEELFIDYGLVVDANDRSAYGCACGSQACRGTMVAKQQIATVP